ncbi:MAG: hypothetical protein A3E85_00615 [Gammaproteobacteria bacterium RIFCSPHIGHO2_12_FULL_45_12]|nr:MAG: hypothetical protein A3E85_00615 [Gammaproteobacteria bacterium RIFCSPHIGHO2_12_FULL_45_12]
MLVRCLSAFLKIMGIHSTPSVPDHLLHCGIHEVALLEPFFHIKLYPMTLPNLSSINCLPSPFLIALESMDCLRLLVGMKGSVFQLYNPETDQLENHSRVMMEKKIMSSWQCCVTNFPVVTTLKDLVRVCFGIFYKPIGWMVGLSFMGGLCATLLPVISSYLFVNFYKVTEGPHFLIFACFFMLMVWQFFLLVNQLLASSLLTTKVMSHLMPSVMNRLLNLNLVSHAKRSAAETVQLCQDYEASVSFCLPSLLSLMQDGLILAFLLLYLLHCHVLLASIYLCICVLLNAIKMRLATYNQTSIQRQRTLRGKFSSLLGECLMQIYKLRTANAEKMAYQRCLDSLTHIKRCEKKVMKIDMVSTGLQLLSPLCLMLLCYVSLAVSDFSATSRKLLPFLMAASQFASVLDMASLKLGFLLKSASGLAPLSTVMSEPSEVVPEQALNMPHKLSIQLQQVGLRDHDTDRWLLSDINLVIEPDQFTAIIGPSGAGKSTLFKLMLGLMPCDQGSVLINQQHIQQYDMKALRRQFGVVLQSSQLLAGTIFSNITAHVPLSLNEVWDLAACVGLAEEVDRMPMKLLTQISDNATESISGGQKQKILLARALAARPQILLLDEATSALDNHSQTLIFDHLIKRKVTLVVIAHRQSTIAGADVIYTIKQGRVVHVARKSAAHGS